MSPAVSVIVRSYDRLPSLCLLVDALLRQRHPSFEIVVVEQSTQAAPEAEARLAELAADPRLRILRRPPLGGAGARNVGVENARGGILLFVLTDVQHDRRRVPVRAVHGTNSSIRRSAWQRFGGWDTDTAIEDEVSFCLRAARRKRAEEYFAYDPRPTLPRNRDVPGGLDKRHMSAGVYLRRYLQFVHRILGRYHPRRVVLLYPLYLLVSYVLAVGWLCRNSRRYASTPSRVYAALVLLVTLPVHTIAALARLFTLEAGRADPAPAHLGPDAVRHD